MVTINWMSSPPAITLPAPAPTAPSIWLETSGNGPLIGMVPIITVNHPPKFLPALRPVPRGSSAAVHGTSTSPAFERLTVSRRNLPTSILTRASAASSPPHKSGMECSLMSLKCNGSRSRSTLPALHLPMPRGTMRGARAVPGCRHIVPGHPSGCPTDLHLRCGPHVGQAAYRML